MSSSFPTCLYLVWAGCKRALALNVSPMTCSLRKGRLAMRPMIFMGWFNTWRPCWKLVKGALELCLETVSPLSPAALLDRSVTAAHSFGWETWSLANPALKKNCGLESKGDRSEALALLLCPVSWLDVVPQGKAAKRCIWTRARKTRRGLQQQHYV